MADATNPYERIRKQQEEEYRKLQEQLRKPLRLTPGNVSPGGTNRKPKVDPNLLPQMLPEDDGNGPPWDDWKEDWWD